MNESDSVPAHNSESASDAEGADDGRQQLMPVNFAAVDDKVYFRTSSDSPLAALTAGRDDVAFGVDQFEDGAGQRWTVTVRGPTSRVIDKSTVEKVNAIGLQLPWAGNNREVLVKLQTQEVDGRRVARYRSKHATIRRSDA